MSSEDTISNLVNLFLDIFTFKKEEEKKEKKDNSYISNLVDVILDSTTVKGKETGKGEGKDAEEEGETVDTVKEEGDTVKDDAEGEEPVNVEEETVNVEGKGDKTGDKTGDAEEGKGDAESEETGDAEETTAEPKVSSNTALVIFKVSNKLAVKEYAYKVFASSGTDAYVNAYLTTIKLNNKDAPYIVSEESKTENNIDSANQSGGAFNPFEAFSFIPLSGSGNGFNSMVTNFVTNVKSFVAPNYYYLVVFKKSDDNKWVIRDETQPFIPILEETYNSLIVNGLKKGMFGGKKSTVHKITRKRNQNKKVFTRKNIKRTSSQK